MADETIEAKVSREHRRGFIRFNVYLCLALGYILSTGVFFLSLKYAHERIGKLERAAHIDHGTHGATTPGPAQHERRQELCADDKDCQATFDAGVYFANTVAPLVWKPGPEPGTEIAWFDGRMIGVRNSFRWSDQLPVWEVHHAEPNRKVITLRDQHGNETVFQCFAGVTK
jgi:hypothetical protein